LSFYELRVFGTVGQLMSKKRIPTATIARGGARLAGFEKFPGRFSGGYGVLESFALCCWYVFVF
jgi:hypothetical protein